MTDSRSVQLALQNDRLRVVILPQEGARIASLRDIQSKTEFLLQPAEPYRKPDALDPWCRFERSACAGIDDCLPSVGADGAEAPGGPIPDHGDFWRLPWAETEPATCETASLAALGYSRPLFFEKRYHLTSSALRIDYRIENRGDAPLPFLYAFHPLLAIDPGDRIVLPPEVSKVRIEYTLGGRLGALQSAIRWPIAQGQDTSVDLSRTEAVSAATADMLYTGRLHSGWCGLYRAQRSQGIIVRFDPHQLPYLGLWLCYGGWPEDPTHARQYAVAPEPTVAPWGTLSAAWQIRQAPVLPTRARFTFSIQLDCTGLAPLTYDEFAAQCAGATAPE